MLSNPHHFCFLKGHYQSVLLTTHFRSSNTSCSSCLLSAVMARSSAYIIFLRTPIVLIFLVINSITMIKRKGLRTLPCLKPLLIGNSSDYPDPTTTVHFVLSYIASFILASASGTPINLILPSPSLLGLCHWPFPGRQIPLPFSLATLFLPDVLMQTSHQSSLPQPFLNSYYSSPNSRSALFRILLFRILSSSSMV